MWFQNRRAKWRKQARLQLLQDAWRMRCLGITNSAMVIENSNAGQLTSSPPTRHSPNSSSTSSKINVNVSKDSSTDMHIISASSNTTTMSRNNGFTLMHPAFQGTNSRQKFFDGDCNEKQLNTENSTITENSNKSLSSEMYPINYHAKVGLTNSNIFSSDKMNHYTNKFNCAVDRKVAESSDSEEIDLTSNGCIDFSNNNNNNNKKNNYQNQNSQELK